MIILTYLGSCIYASVLIIGGGPVGLYAGVRLREKGIPVSIVEKREEYTRGQIFSLSDEHEPFKSISLLSDRVVGDLWQFSYAHGSIMFWPSISQHAKCHLQVPPRETRNFLNYYGSVPISEFERALRKEFIHLGGNLIIGEGVVDHNGRVTVNGQEQEYTHLVCADGRNSQCRQMLFDPFFPQVQLNSQGDADGYGVTVVIGAGHISEKLLSATLTDHLYEGSVMSQHRYRAFLSKQGQWYLGIGASRREYEEWKDLSIAENDELWREIKAALSYYRLCECGEADRLRRHFSLSFFPIHVTHQPKNGFARLSDNRKQLYTVMGDAAYGTHFFTGTGLNAGLFLANSLVEAMEMPQLSQQVLHLNRMGKYITEYNIPWAESICKWLRDDDDDEVEDLRSKFDGIVPAGFLENANQRTLKLMNKNLHTYQARFEKRLHNQNPIVVRAPIMGEGSSIVIARLLPRKPIADPPALIRSLMQMGGAPAHGFVGIKLVQLVNGMIIGEGCEFEEFYHRIYRAIKQLESSDYEIIFGLPTVESVSIPDLDCKQDYLVDLGMARIDGLSECHVN